MKKIFISKLSYKVNENNLFLWYKADNTGWDTETDALLNRFLNADKVHFDISARIGSKTGYAAQDSKEASPFEPNPATFKFLRVNYELNEREEWYNQLTIINKPLRFENGLTFTAS
jgi:hypothetical protein